VLIVTLVVLGGALAVGLVANRYVRPFAKSEVQGVKLELLVSPLLTLTVLLLSFVLVQAFSSFNRVRAAESEEAGRIAHQYELAGYFDDDEGVAIPIRSALVCYSAAVIEQEWPGLADGPALDPRVGEWGTRINPVLAELSVIGDTDQPYGNLVNADRDRADARRKRITESDPAVPPVVTGLMLGISAAALLAIATFTLPYVSRRVQFGALVVMATVFAGMQITIHEIDGKFDGVIEVEPTDIEIVREALTVQFAELYPDEALPCDADGNPV